MGVEGINSRILAILHEAERTFPVHTWVYDGTEIWPLMRIQLATALHEHWRDPTSASALLPGNKGSWLRQAASSWWRRHAAVRQDRANEADPRAPHDVVFLNEHRMYNRVAGRWYEHYCDPFVDAFEAEGLRCLVWDSSIRYRVPRYRPTAFVRPRLDAATLLARLRRPPAGSVCGSELQALRAFFVEHGVSLPASVFELGGVWQGLRTMADMLKGWLGPAGTKLALATVYYNHYSMALALACHELGIPVVDIQHGVQSEHNLFYGPWLRLPQHGYRLLPDFFWCWSQDDVRMIASWADAAPGRHQAIAGGNMLLQAWPRLDPAERDREQEAMALVQVGREPAILVTLSGLEPPGDLDALVGAIAAAPPTWFWWLRSHPNRPAQAEVLDGLLQRAGITNANTRLAISLPLYTLLGRVQAHLTGFSASTLEAAALGVPTILWHPDGPEVFPAQMRSGWACYAEGPARAVELIDARLAFASEAGRAVGAPLGPAALQVLVERLRRGGPVAGGLP